MGNDIRIEKRMLTVPMTVDLYEAFKTACRSQGRTLAGTVRFFASSYINAVAAEELASEHMKNRRKNAKR